jgi:hypothetical protein
MSKAITYTDAPAAYDGFGSETLSLAGRTDRGPVRKVETPSEHAEWQRQRYASGNYLSAAEGVEWDRCKSLVRTLTREGRVEAAAPFLLAALGEALPELEATLRAYGDDGTCLAGLVSRCRKALGLATS